MTQCSFEISCQEVRVSYARLLLFIERVTCVLRLSPTRKSLSLQTHYKWLKGQFKIAPNILAGNLITPPECYLVGHKNSCREPARLAVTTYFISVADSADSSDLKWLIVCHLKPEDNFEGTVYFGYGPISPSLSPSKLLIILPGL